MRILKSTNMMIVSVVVLFVAGVLANSSYAKIDPKTCVGMWLFDEDKDDVAEDSSGNGNHATLENGPEWVEGKFGKALSFDGKDDYVDLGSSGLDVDYITVSFLVKFNDTSGQPAMIVRDGSPRVFAIYMVSPTKLRFWTMVNGSWIGEGHDVNFTPEIGRWYHIAGTKGKERQKLYLDGAMLYDGSHPGAIDKGNTIASLGRNPSGAYTYFNGLIDEVAIFNEVLEEEDIQAIMNQGLGRALGITAIEPAGKLATTWGQIKARY